MPSRAQYSNPIRRHRLYLALLATGMAFAALPSQAGVIGAFVVNTVLDTQDANPGDGQALDSAGRTSLRAAIDEANALGGARAIQFAASLTAGGDAPIELSLFDSGTDSDEVGPTAFTIAAGTTLTITGASGDNGVSVSRATGTSAFRYFHVESGASLSLNALTLRGGRASAGHGGAGSGAGGGGAAGLGGAIFNQGSVTLQQVTLSDNAATGGSGGRGGGSTSGRGGGGGGGLASNGGDSGGSSSNSPGAAGGGPNGGAGGTPGAAGGDGGGGGGGNADNGTGGHTGHGAGTGGRFGGGGAGGGAAATGAPAVGGAGANGGYGGGGGGGGKARAPGQSATGGVGGSGGFGAGGGTTGETGDAGRHGDGGGGVGLGGAIFNYGGALTIRNSTLSGNTATGGSSGFVPSPYGGLGAGGSGGAGSGFGAAIFSTNRDATAASVELRHVTVSASTVAAGQTSGGIAGTSGGAIYSLSDGGNATLTLNNSIVADTSGGNDVVVASINAGISTSSGAGNLIETQNGYSGGISSSADPILAALADNRGPTATQVPDQASPAIDGGDASQIGGLVTDQRGGSFLRIADGNLDGSSVVDIGAVELIQIDYGDAPDFATGTGAAESLLQTGDDDLRLSNVGPDGDTNRAAFQPRVAYNASDDEFLVVWGSDEVADGENEIYGRRFDGATRQALAPAFRISTMGTDGDFNFFATSPDVAWSSQSNEYLVVWSGDHSVPGDNDFEIFGRFVAADGSLQGTQTRVSQMGPDLDENFFASSARVAYSGASNEFLVVWQGDDSTPPLVDNEFEVFGQRLDAATRAFDGARLRISHAGADGDFFYGAFSPAIAWNALRDTWLVTWQADDNAGGLVDNEVEIFGRLVAGGGAPSGVQFRISEMGPDGDTSYRGNNPALAYNDVADEFLVVWHGNDDEAGLDANEIEIFGQRVSGADGSDAGAQQRISDMGPLGVQNYIAVNPAVSYGAATDNFLVAWSGDEEVDNDFDVWARRIGADGSVQDADEVRLSTMGPDGSTLFNANSAAVAFNSNNGDALVVWFGDDDRVPLVDDETEIFGQFLTDTPLIDYRTRGKDNGPSHVRSAGLTLGTLIDSDPDGLSSQEADGDDLAGVDDEDGSVGLVQFDDNAPQLAVNVFNSSGQAATLYGWIDYDGDGEFENATERGSVAVANGTSGDVQLNLPLPPANAAVNTFARLRLSSAAGAADAVGQVSGGEVEDYPAINIIDTMPNPFNFVDQSNVARSTVITSAPVVIAGINAATPISASGGSYSINGAPFTADPGSVMPGDAIRAQHQSAAGFGSLASVVIDIGGVVDSFSSVTLAVDLLPDAFAFTPVSDVARSSTQVSNTITVSGINSTATVSVLQGEYSINGGGFVSGDGNVVAGDTVTVRHEASAAFSTATTTTLQIGSGSANFVSTTEAADSTPDAFAFVDQGDVALSVTVTSAPITVAGINTGSQISVSNGSYSINGGAFTTIDGTVQTGDEVRAQHQSAATATTGTDTIVTIGGAVDTFTSTTHVPDTTPDPFSFVDQVGIAPNAQVTSAPITVAGTNTTTGISVVDGEYSINGGAFTAVAGTVQSGDQVRVTHVAANAFSTPTDTTVTIGSVADTFTSTTQASDTTPDPFSFIDQIGIEPGAEVTSAPVTVGGINDSTAISVSGGEYSINGGAFTSLVGTVQPGDQVRLRHVAANTFATPTDTTATIGSVADTFTSTTRSAGADASISKSDGGGTPGAGATVTYTVVVTNIGDVALVDAVVADTLPAQLTGATWNCLGGGGGSCALSGSGDIADTVDLPVGATVTYTLGATVVAGASGELSNTATVTLTGQSDATPANNSATDVTSLQRIFANGFE